MTRLSFLSMMALMMYVYPFTAASEPARMSRLEAIDALRDSGQIDEETRGLYLLSLLHAPELLPPEIQRLPMSAPCLTTVALEAARSLATAGPRVRDDARRILGPPPVTAGSIDSTDGYPIRVYYQTEDDLEMAETVLDYAEQSLAAQVDLLGWTPPVGEEEGEPVPRLDVYVVDVPYDASGYCEPLANNGLTSWTDALVRCHINRENEEEYLFETVQHEIHHAIQFSEDAIEFPTAFEMFGVHTMNVLIEDNWEFMLFLPYFQTNPDFPVFWMSRTNPYYHFGSGLFAQFLDERYGASDARLAVQLWQEARQDGDIRVVDWYVESDTPNDPDIFDVLVRVLRDEHETTLEAAVTEFAEWRLLLGSFDDGNHFRQGASWVGGEPTMDVVLDAGELPVTEEPVGSPPMPTGTSYVRVLTDALEGPERLRVAVDLATDTRWAVQVVGIHPPDEATITSVEPVDGHAEAVVPAAGFDSLVLALTNLGTGDIDPASLDYRPADATYTLELLRQPTVTAIEPAAATAGISGLEVTVTAEPLDPDATLDLGPGISVGRVNVLDLRTLTAIIDIAPDAEPGARDVSVTNPGGDPGVLAGGFEVLAAPAPVLDSLDPSELDAGETGVLTLVGSGLLRGATATLGEGIEVTSVDVVDGERAYLNVEVAGDAAPGSRDLVVTNPGGAAATLEEALTVLGDDGGCSCRAAGRRRAAAGTIELLDVLGAL